jgi:hypothetical protein
MRTPPAKFANDPCNAIPIAKPAAPISAMNEVVWIPNMPATEMNNNTFNHTVMMLARNLLTVISIFVFANAVFAIFPSRLITRNQITSVAIAPIIVGAHCNALSRASAPYLVRSSGCMMDNSKINSADYKKV